MHFPQWAVQIITYIVQLAVRWVSSQNTPCNLLHSNILTPIRTWLRKKYCKVCAWRAK